MRLVVEQLEDRLTPASISLQGGLLSILGDDAPNVVNVGLSADSMKVLATIDNQSAMYATVAVQMVRVEGEGGNDILTVLLPSVTTIMEGDRGDDTLWTFGNDRIFGGTGADTIYSIVGTSVIDGGFGRDRLIGNGTTLFGNDREDRPNVVFGVTTQPVQLLGGVLYLLGSGGDDRAIVQEQGGQLQVVYNGQTMGFARGAVDTIAGVLGNGNDHFLNFSTVDSVVYGAAGDDVLVGGGGVDLLKGGAGNDVLVGNGRRDDLSGDAGADVLVGGADSDILRADLLDVLLADDRDLILRF